MVERLQFVLQKSLTLSDCELERLYFLLKIGQSPLSTLLMFKVTVWVQLVVGPLLFKTL